jgi:hypothetical protein
LRESALNCRSKSCAEEDAALRFFKELGTGIDRAWRRIGYDEASFPELAADWLTRHPASEHVEMMDVVGWIHSTSTLHRRANFASTFGQPSVRVFDATHFYIDVLFWLEATTDIHQHGFSGAFHVMSGSSLHSRFTFEPRVACTTRLILGDLSVSTMELLREGAVRCIPAGNHLIHSLFHLDHPSVSIVVRTPDDGRATPQYSYSRAGIAYDSTYTNEALYLRSQTLLMLRRLNHPKYFETAVEAVRSADSCDAFFLMRAIFEWTQSVDDVSMFLDAIESEHRDVATRMREWYRWLRRDIEIVVRRKDVTRREQRFLLGVLLNAPSRAVLLRLVAEAFPGRPAAALIADWIQELSSIHTRDRLTGALKNAVGFPVNEVGAFVLRCLLDGANDAELVLQLRDAFCDADVAEYQTELLSLAKRFRESLLFDAVLVPDIPTGEPR